MKKRITATAALIAALGSMVGASTAEQAQNDLREGMRPVALDGGSVLPVSGENHLNASFLARESFDQRIHIPHPPIDEIPEMPMPEPVAPGVTPMHENPSTVMFHDALTGETYEKPLPFHTGAVSGVSQESDYAGYNNVIDNAIEHTRGFGNMSITGGLATAPRSYNVKLVMRFTDTGGVQRWFVCSGSMQDPGVVLSAAHCVYARTPNGLTINDWADIVYVYPSWDGVSNNGQFSAPDGDEIIQNYGYAFGTSYIAGSNYVNSGSFDADVGCIRLTRGSSRNLGALTGYYAWAWGFSCGDIQSRTYHNFSYPTENCPTPGLHTGLDMYYWNGTIDSCPGNQLQLNTGGNCLDTVWGGMSGSAMYYIDDGTRRAHAVCSNSNRTTSGRYAKLWETFTNDMVDFENNTRGNTLDIEPMRFRPRGSSTVLQGQAMDDSFDVTMVNATNNNPASDTYTIRVYLSTNNNISAADTLLATWNYTVDFAAMQNFNFVVPAPVIPIDTPPGDYFVGVILADGTDGWDNNNDTDTWDAHQITVAEAFADLDAQLCNAVAGTYYQGQNISVTHRTWNFGDRPADDTRLEFRASTNTIISTFDTFMEERFYGTVAIDDDVFVVSNVQIPSDLPPGNYYIGTIVETSDNEADLGNNSIADTDTITVLVCVPDLTGDGFVNFFDVSAFLSAYNAQDPIADFNNDGMYNFFDVSAFLTAYNAGCP